MNSFDRAQAEYERRSPEDAEDKIRLRQRLDERDLDRADAMRDREKDEPRDYDDVDEDYFRAVREGRAE